MPGSQGFESRFYNLAQERGAYWFARDLMALLGYCDWNAFKDVIGKAATMANASRPDDFSRVTRNVNGEEVEDFKLTRNGCFAAALSADRRIPAAATAQDYFVAEVRYEFEDFIEWRP